MGQVLSAYDSKVAAGDITPDDDQRAAVVALDGLLDRLAAPPPRPGPLAALPLPWRRKARDEGPQGAYLHGGVGRGKTMVMDLFFAHAPLEAKRRVHFHAFMLEVHDFLHARRKAAGASGMDDALMACAADIAARSRLLCLDEFQVKDVADAMILGRLFTALFEAGVTVVMTSNVAPDDLYENGLQRDRFLPFIALLKARLLYLPFTGARDYRLNRLRGRQVYFWPDDADARARMEEMFLAISDGDPGDSAEISFKGRVLHVPRAAREVCAFSFEQLCGGNKSAADYLELVRRYRVFIVYGVPRMDDRHRNAVLRFVTLVDTLYDHRARLVASAAAAPEALYSGEEQQGVFARTASRLIEMQSVQYRDAA